MMQLVEGRYVRVPDRELTETERTLEWELATVPHAKVEQWYVRGRMAPGDLFLILGYGPTRDIALQLARHRSGFLEVAS